MAKQRTAKQKAATRKLVALNKRKRKGTTKGMVRKTARRAFEGKRKSSKTKRKSSSSNRTRISKPMAKRRMSRTRRAGSKISNVLTSGIVGKAVTGIGAAALVGTVMNRILPGSPITGIAQPIAAYAAGGAVGAITSVILNGGLQSITGFLGGQQAATPSVGTVEFGV
ncbi:MAG: hypothetical protein [Circular genetic element sp.]|jgi:hypothetical protein|nr:MAG: hypothetical protein [Circular genetic element sp.]|tara:strand:- start:117 stop:620 length:504 start_codon:yes stop_codon:yes gene_type:complete